MIASVRAWYRFAAGTVAGLGRLLAGLRVVGRENLPPPPCIIAANHISLLDPPILGSVVPYELAYMAKIELFRNPLFGALIRSLNAFPVRRGQPDREAIDRALRVLGRGRGLILFPEGTRDKSGGPIRPAKLGVGYMAFHTRLSVVPVYISGTNRLSRAILRSPPIRVEFGPALPPPEDPGDDPGARRAAYEAMATAWREAVTRMRERRARP